jgi:hypothetical protein
MERREDSNLRRDDGCRLRPRRGPKLASKGGRKGPITHFRPAGEGE